MRHCCMTRGAGGGLGTVGACFFTVLMSTNCGCCRGGSRIGRTTVPSGGFPPVDAQGLRGLKEQSTCNSKRTKVATRAPNLISLEQASLRSTFDYGLPRWCGNCLSAPTLKIHGDFRLQHHFRARPSLQPLPGPRHKSASSLRQRRPPSSSPRKWF